MDNSSRMLADYIMLSRFNYLYPTGTLPSNLFFRKTEKNPYWLANDLENIRFSLSQKGSTPEEEEDVPEDVSDEETEAKEEIAKAESQAEIAKAESQAEIAKAQAEVEKAKATLQAEIAKTEAEVEKVKAESQVEIAKAEAEEAKAEAEKAKAEAEKAKAEAEKAKAEAEKLPDIPEEKEDEEKKDEEKEDVHEHDDYDFNITLSNSLNSFLQDGFKAKVLGFTDVNLTLKVGDGAVIDFFQKFRERLSGGDSLSDIRSVVEQETGDLLKNNSLITSLNFDDISIETDNRASFLKTVNQLLTRSRINRRFEHSVTKTVDGDVMTVVMSVGTKDGQSFSSAILPNERTQLHSSTDETFEVGGLTIDFGNYNALTGGLADTMGIPINSDWDIAKDEVELTYEYTDGYKMTFSTPIARSVEDFTTKQTSFFVPPADVDPGKLIATYGIFFDVPIAQRQSSELKSIDMKVLLNLK